MLVVLLNNTIKKEKYLKFQKFSSPKTFFTYSEFKSELTYNMVLENPILTDA